MKAEGVGKAETREMELCGSEGQQREDCKRYPRKYTTNVEKPKVK